MINAMKNLPQIQKREADFKKKLQQSKSNGHAKERQTLIMALFQTVYKNSLMVENLAKQNQCLPPKLFKSDNPNHEGKVKGWGGRDCGKSNNWIGMDLFGWVYVYPQGTENPGMFCK